MPAARTMTRRLLASYVGVALVILVTLEVPLGLIEAHHERHQATAVAVEEATSLAVAAANDVDTRQVDALHTLVLEYRRRLGADVSIVAPDATVLAEADPAVDTADAEGRPVLLAALDGRAEGVLRSTASGTVVTAAVPIRDGSRLAGAVLLVADANATTDRIREVWAALVAFGLGVLVLTGAVGALLARSLTRPVARLTAVVAALGDGDLSSRAAVDSGPAELRALAVQFNQMASRLEQLIDAQVDFEADASHQLRSPLTALRLRLENLEATGDEVVAGNLAAAGREVARLSRIVDGLLVLGRAERSQPDRRPVDLPPAIAERCDAWAALAAERRVTLARDGTDHLAPAVLVPGDLEQILDNLLANALDASTAGSTITVTLRGGAGRAEIHVVDEGPGLSDEDRSRAFDRFWQGQAHSGGTSGLGLAIVRQLARRNDLDVRLDAAAGGGVDAVVSVPLPSVGRPVLEPGTALVRHRPSPE